MSSRAALQISSLDQTRLRLGGLILMAGAIAVAHYAISPHAGLYHDVLRRSMYVPIVLGALWFGTLGGVSVALSAALLYAPHMFFQLHLTSGERVDRVAEMFLYVVVGGLAGLLAERERFHRLQAERALAEVQQAHAEMRDQAAQLADIQDALRQVERLSTLGELAADLAHEVRNPLAALRGTVQILTGDPPPEEKVKFARILIEELDRLDRVVEGYLRAARAGAAKGGQADAVAAISSVLGLVRRQAERNRVTIEREGVHQLRVAMDLHRLTQVLMNLVLNAVQAMPDGGLLRITCEVARDAERKPAWGEITFHDRGPGIPIAERENVFRPFYTTKPSGTGLGLSIARRLLKEHGGSLTLEAPQEGGSLFRLRLPLIPNPDGRKLMPESRPLKADA